MIWIILSTSMRYPLSYAYQIIKMLACPSIYDIATYKYEQYTKNDQVIFKKLSCFVHIACSEARQGQSAHDRTDQRREKKRTATTEMDR